MSCTDRVNATLPASVEPGDALTPMQAAALGTVIQEIMRPVLETLTKMLEQNTAALDQLAAAQSIQNDRLEALERQVRLNTPVSAREAQYINDRIRTRARELLDRCGLSDDRKAVTKLANAIRRSLLARYGAAGVREIPKHEYTVAMHLIDIWNDALTVRDVMKEARRRAEVAVEEAERAQGADGT